MKSSVCFLLSACLAGLLFSCAANPNSKYPEWVTKLPQPPKNCDYQRGEGTAETRDKARKKAEEDALDKTLISGMNIRKTDGVNHKFICNHIIEENTFKYNAHALLIYQTDFREKCDFNEGLRNCESKPVPVNPNDENSAEAGKKIVELSQKTASLGTLAQKFEWTNNPKERNEIWHEGSKLHKEINELQTELQALGAGTNVDSIANVFEKMQKSCIEYRKNMKVHWEDAENECSDAVFARLSKKTSMEKSACSGGFKFRFACEEKCKSLSYGVECSFEPSLAVESCGGKRYSMLKVSEPVTGSDMNNKSRAMEDLIENLPKAAFFEQWEKEIKEWVPQCVD